MDDEFNDPLDEDEIDALDDFLMSDAVGDDAMDVSMLDGYLTALAVGPNNLPPDRWLPVIWGESVAWASQAQAKRMTTLVLRHANDILFMLRGAPDDFEPLLLEREVDGERVPIIDDWCTGFVIGISLDEAAWQPLLDADGEDGLLHPILLFGTEEGWQRREADPTLESRYGEFAAGLGECVMRIMEWWLPVRKARSTIRRAVPKVGRNAPCPCGSGRKFKQCCERQGSLH